MPADKLEKLLNRNGIGELSDLIRRARDMGELTETLSNSLPAELAESVIAANVRDNGELIVICRSPAWAARLRYETEALLKAARAAGETVTSCRVRVSHDTS